MDGKLEEFKELNDSDKLQELRLYLHGLDHSYIVSEVTQIVWKTDGLAKLQALLNGLGNSKQFKEIKLQITESLLQEIEQKQLPARAALDLVNILACELTAFSSCHLIKLTELCCDMIRYPNTNARFACWKEMLPKLLHMIMGLNTTIEDANGRCTSETYKSNILDRICSEDWKESYIVDMAAMFVDMPVNKAERTRVVRKLCHLLPKMQCEQIPPLVEQLVNLTQSENSAILFLALTTYFEENLYNKMKEKTVDYGTPVAAIEGKILRYIINNPEGCKELLKTLKACSNAPEFVLRPFFVTLLLALSSLPTYEEEVMGTFKTVLNRELNESKRLSESAWLRSVCPSAIDVQELFSKVLANCFRDRDSVLDGAIKLGFHLMSAGKTFDGLHRLGTFILEDLVRRNKLVTVIVLGRLNDYLKQVSDAPQYADCLNALTRKHPMCVLECKSSVEKLLETCHQVPTARSASRILFALLPLGRYTPWARNIIVNVLRRALFPQDVERRIMSVSGFLELLRNLKISNLHKLSQSMSQNFCNMTQLCSQSLGSGTASLSNEALCLEILTVLREVFKQQHQVKTVLYRGVYSAVQANSDLGLHALDFIQSWMERWYVAGDTPVPIKFHEAVSVDGTNAKLVEPLGDLTLSLSLIVAKLHDESRSTQLRELFDSMCLRMGTCELSHFKLDPEGGSIMDCTPQGMKSQEVLRQILSVYDALMGYLLCTWNKGTTEKSEPFLKLFKGHKVLSDFARGLGKDKKKPDKKTKTDKGKPFVFPTTVLNFKCCSRLLCVINNVTTSWAPDDSSINLCGSRELHRYACNVTLQLIHDARALPVDQLAKDVHSSGYLCAIGRTLYTKYVLRIPEMKAFDLPALVTALLAFVDLLALVLSHYKSKLNYFVNEILGEQQGSQRENGLIKVLDQVLEQLDNVLDEEACDKEKEDLQTKKLNLLYLSVISTLVQQIPLEANYALPVYEKVKTVCLEKSSEKASEAKALLGLLLMLHRNVCAYSDADDTVDKMVQIDVAKCLCKELEVNDDEEETASQKYSIVTTATGHVCVVALCESLQQHLADIEWTINRFKSEVEMLLFSSETSLEVRMGEQREAEADVCRHLITLVRSLSSMCRLEIPAGATADAVLRTVELAYNRLSLLAKYFLAKFGKFEAKIDGTKFEKTVRVVEVLLTRRISVFTDSLITAGYEDKRGNLKSRSLKETKHIPKVILEKEQYHKLLIQLGKRCKTSLSSHVEQAVTRDYQIPRERFLAAVQNQESEMDVTGEDEGNTSNGENEAPTPKRRRSNVMTDDTPQSNSDDD